MREFESRRGHLSPEDLLSFGCFTFSMNDVFSDYSALTQSAGLVSLSDFGALLVQGRDRVAWLHKLTTANVEVLGEGSGAYGLLLNAKGHVLADFNVLIRTAALILYTGARAKTELYSNLRRAIFREKVTLADLGDTLAVLSVQGPEAARVVATYWGGPLPVQHLQFAEKDELLLVRRARMAAGGFDVLVPRAQVETARDALIAAGALPVGIEALNVARVEAGIPWYGEDFDETMLAPEARLDAFIAENKGCYTGQEVMARIRNRGHVNRLLVALQVEGKMVPARGDRVLAGDAEIGWVTSPVWSFARNAPLALGYTRREHAERGASVEIEHGGTRLAARVAVLSVSG